MVKVTVTLKDSQFVEGLWRYSFRAISDYATYHSSQKHISSSALNLKEAVELFKFYELSRLVIEDINENSQVKNWYDSNTQDSPVRREGTGDSLTINGHWKSIRIER